MEVSMLGVELELIAMARLDLSLICNLHLSSGQCQILNTLSKARDQTLILKTLCWGLNPLSYNGNSEIQLIL